MGRTGNPCRNQKCRSVGSQATRAHCTRNLTDESRRSSFINEINLSLRNFFTPLITELETMVFVCFKILDFYFFKFFFYLKQGLFLCCIVGGSWERENLTLQGSSHSAEKIRSWETSDVLFCLFLCTATVHLLEEFSCLQAYLLMCFSPFLSCYAFCG